MHRWSRVATLGALLMSCALASAAAAQDAGDPGVPSPYVVLVGSPAVAGATVMVTARVSNASVLLGRLLVADREIASATTPVMASRGVAVKLTLPLDATSRATLARTGVLRAALVLEATGSGPTPTSIMTRPTTLVSRPERTFQRTGRVRTGGFGSQLLRGTSLGDLLQGDSGGDQLFGRYGDDKLLGGTGDDRLHGGPGDDLLDGDDGDDVSLPISSCMLGDLRSSRLSGALDTPPPYPRSRLTFDGFIGHLQSESCSATGLASPPLGPTGGMSSA